MLGRRKAQAQRAIVAPYEFKNVDVTDRLAPWPKRATKVAEDKIREMEKQGWEYMQTLPHGMSARLTLQFRRLK